MGRDDRAATTAAIAVEALAGLDDGAILVDARGAVVFANRSAARMLGRESIADDLGRLTEIARFYRPDEITLWPAEELPLVRALAGAECRGVAMFLKPNTSRSGTHLEASAAPTHDASGAISGAWMVLRDMSESRGHERKWNEAGRQLEAILDNIQDMAWLKDRDGRFVAVNRHHLEFYNLRLEDFIGLTDYDVYTRELAERFRADDAEVMRTGARRCVEEQVTDARGEVHWLETIKMPVFSSSGEILGTTGTARDITARKRTEAAFRSMNDDLERRVNERTDELAAAHESLVRQERLAVLGQLAGGVAHQIRNPLAAIQNASYVLEHHFGAARHPDAEDSLRVVRDEIRHANVIISGLLDYARVRPPDRHPTSLSDVVERTLRENHIPDNVTVERVLSDVPLIHVDAEQIHGAIFNLTRNAVEAMPDGGVLRIEVAASESTPDELVVAISDTGSGIPVGHRQHLFEPLVTTKPRGIGLGLVTARTMVEAHGGRIAYVPVPKGTRFEIRLPLVPRAGSSYRVVAASRHQ